MTKLKFPGFPAIECAGEPITEQPSLHALYDRWSAPWTGDHGSETDCAARRAETRDLAARILAAPVGTVVGGGQWSPQVTVAVKASIGGLAAGQALLTSDGQRGDPHHWCQGRCHGDEFGVYYERWSGAGRETHGWLCSECRLLTQSG